MNEQSEKVSSDSMVDAIAAIVIVAVSVTAALYWVASQ